MFSMWYWASVSTPSVSDESPRSPESLSTLRKMISAFWLFLELLKNFMSIFRTSSGMSLSWFSEE